jgi:uncharacterized phage protein (TIGR01671 family)
MEKREIKFRCWDAINNKWLLGYDLPNLGGFSMKGEVMLFGEYSNTLNTFRLQDLDKCVVMQYVGLKDKNGKEIYEGDVIDYGTDKNMVVMWHQKFASFVLRKEGWAFAHFFGEAIEHSDKCEIIGNVFEHPNLVTPNK